MLGSSGEGAVAKGQAKRDNDLPTDHLESSHDTICVANVRIVHGGFAQYQFNGHAVDDEKLDEPRLERACRRSDIELNDSPFSPW